MHSAVQRRAGTVRPSSTSTRQLPGPSSRRSVTTSATGNYYELLGVESSASEEEIKAAFRRRAKELHPDVNPDEDAGQDFMACKQAYEVLTDPARRREYDATISVRRIGFFRDIVEEEEEEESARADPWEIHRRMWEEEEAAAAAAADKEGAGGGPEDPAEMLERLARVMGGWGAPPSLRDYQSGRLDPWGQSSSDSWFRRVEEQSNTPFTRGRGVGAAPGWEREGLEWGPHRPQQEDPFEKKQGWRPPGRGSEWQQRPRWEEDDDGQGPGRSGRGGGMGGGGLGGGFGGQPLRKH